VFAVNLLLQLKGAEFQTKTPEFVIPTAENYLGYCQAVNTQFSKTRIRVNTKRRALRAPRPVASFGVGRPVSERLTAFSSFITGGALETATPFEHFLTCAAIVMEASFNYLFVIEYMKRLTHGAKNPGVETVEALGEPAFHHAVQKLTKCYFDVYCSSAVAVKQPTTEVLYNYLNLYLVPLYKLPGTPTANVLELAKVSTTAFDTLYTDGRFLRRQVQDPLSIVFVREGFVIKEAE
jgi:hypothetical protein